MAPAGTGSFDSVFTDFAREYYAQDDRVWRFYGQTTSAMGSFEAAGRAARGPG
jgi:hypothetical protein